MSAGPVTAHVTVKATGEAFDAAGPGWLSGRPQIDNVVTLYDFLFQQGAAQGWHTALAWPSYTAGIHPVSNARGPPARWWGTPCTDTPGPNPSTHHSTTRGSSTALWHHAQLDFGALTASPVRGDEGVAGGQLHARLDRPADSQPAPDACRTRPGGAHRARRRHAFMAFRGRRTSRTAAASGGRYCARTTCSTRHNTPLSWDRDVTDFLTMTAAWHTLGFVVRQGDSYVEVGGRDGTFVTLRTPHLDFRDVLGTGGAAHVTCRTETNARTVLAATYSPACRLWVRATAFGMTVGRYSLNAGACQRKARSGQPLSPN